MEFMVLQDYEKEHLALVRKGAAEGTLFFNTDGTFPLDEAGKIAAYGAGVRNTVKGGTGSGEVNSRFSVNIEQGLVEAGFTITSTDWLDAYDKAKAERKARYAKELREEAKAAKANAFMHSMGKICPEPEIAYPLDAEGDVAIYVLARNSGEGMDRKNEAGDIKLTESEIRDILALNEKYEKFMLVLNVGGVVDLAPVCEVKNILLLSQLGVVTGNVLADILLGNANPSGKLATTWAALEDYSDIGDFGDDDETHYKEGIYVGYRYFDSVGKKALYPFGFGKSYTTYAIEVVKAELSNTTANVSVKVTNTGVRAGKEVVQVYVSAPWGKLDKPYQDLAAFAKTKELAGGESEVLEISFDLRDLASYCEETASYILEKGNYLVRVGNSSVETQVAAVIALDETAEVLKAKNVLGEPGFEDYKAPEYRKTSLPSDITILPLRASEIKTMEVTYEEEAEIDAFVEGLTEEELGYLQIGAFTPGAKGLSIIGNAGTKVAGTAGETTSLLEAKGVPGLVMADGPAGLRMSRQYYIDKKGRVQGTGAGMLPESMMEYMTGIIGFLAKKVLGEKKVPKYAKLIDQYATAIPIGTSVAMSFNYDLAKAYGDMVGSEMERFGIHLWLAPALNIHRDIRCGRNFEYYSEDPLVSGLMAAAITEGVQSHPGRATTIKHYAVNNQETNRYGNNSNVSERALREIYLKGFGICVKKAKPLAVMTSYNLLNGTHTSEHRGLNEDVLRKEYGFDGLVMTDWVISFAEKKGGKYRIAHSPETAMAGGDLFMPGGKADYEKLMKAMKEGKVTKEQAKINATRVYKTTKLLGDK